MLSALDNLEAVLAQADMTFANVVWMNTYVTDINEFNTHVAEPLAERLARFDVRPPGVLSSVTALARPELLIELQMIAADYTFQRSGGTRARQSEAPRRCREHR